MAIKPTYEELEQRIKALESHLEQMEEALRVSEERNRLGTSAAKIGVWDWNIKTGDFYLDPNIKAILGYTDDEIPNDLEIWVKYVHPEDSEAVMEAAQECLDGKTSEYIFEHRMLHKNGSNRWILVRGKAIRDESGNAVRLIGTDADITERKRTEEVLHESKSKLSAMLTSIGDHISMIDKDLNIIWTNEIAEKTFGNDIVGKKCYEVYHKRTEPCEPYPCITLSAFQDGKIHEHDTQVIDKDGQTMFFHRKANVALRDKEGKPVSVMEISRDITKKVQADNELQKAKDELEHRVKERTKELEIKTNSLEEVNTAMKVLLKKREEDKEEFENNILANLKGMIEPYFKKIKKTRMDDQQKVLFSIIESNLKEIVSPFANKLSSKYISLTPSEIQVADFVKHGKRTKEIATLLNLSIKTIEHQRESIRKKLGIKNRKTNLRSYLLSFR